MRFIFAFLFSCLTFISAQAGVNCTLPFVLQNNTLADANQVMANFNQLVGCLLNAAAAGQNNDITALNALSTPVNPTQGGTPLYLGGTSGGTANNQTVATTTPTGFTQGSQYMVAFYAGATNTGAMSLNVNATGITAFYNQSNSGPVQMTGGEVIAGQVVIAVYNNKTAAPPPGQPTWNNGWYECLNCGGVQRGGFGAQQGIAAAPVTDIGPIGSHNVILNGSGVTINSFGPDANPAFPVYFIAIGGANTIVSNTSNCTTVGGCIITPGNANITTQNGDTAWLMYLGNGSNLPAAGNWQVMFYQRATGVAIVNPTPNCGFNGLVWSNFGSTSTVSASWNSSVLVTTAAIPTPIYSGQQLGLQLNVTTGSSTSTAGGMDGHPANTNSFIFMYAISNGSAWALLGSPQSSASGVILPTGYQYICYLGAVRTALTSSNLIGMAGLGRDVRYVVGGPGLTALPLIATGAVGTNCVTTGTIAYAVVATRGTGGNNVWAPTNANAIDIVGVGSYNAGGVGVLNIAPNTSYGQSNSLNPAPLVINTATSAVVRIMYENGNNTAWCSSTAGGAMLAYGFIDQVNAN